MALKIKYGKTSQKQKARKSAFAFDVFVGRPQDVSWVCGFNFGSVKSTGLESFGIKKIVNGLHP